MADLLDYAKHNLEYRKAAVQARIDLMKAYADFNFRMMEVAEKQAEVATKRLKLKRLKDAFLDYRAARKEAKKEQNRIKRLADRVERHARRLPTLLLGETLPADNVSAAWSALVYFINNIDAVTLLKITSIKASQQARRGIHYSKNRYPHLSCKDAPADKKYAWPLLLWAKKKSYLPRIGSSPYKLMGKIILLLSKNAKETLESIEATLEEAQQDLTRLRKDNWKTINVTEHPAKKPEK